MARQISAWTLLMCCGFGSTVTAQAAEDYVAAGRFEMAAGTLAGFAEADLIFDAGINDAGGPNCAGDRELIFLHAVTRAVMLFVDYGDVVAADDLFGLAEEFGMTFAETAAAFVNRMLGPDDAGGPALSLPADPDTVGRTLHDTVLPELDRIVAQLDAISDWPTPFVMHFTPSETGLKTDLEVDYGEVLVLKGLLLAYRSLLEVRSSGNLHVVVTDSRGLGGTTGFLPEYVRSLTVSPRSKDANDGPPMVAQAREDLAGAIGCWLDAIDYIGSENDPPGTDWQEDELLYFDADTLACLEHVRARLRTLLDSLQHRAVAQCILEQVMTYRVYDANAAYLGEFVLSYDFTGRDGRDGRLTLNDGTVLDVEWVTIEPRNTIMIELSARTQWLEAWFEGTLSADRSTIAGGRLEYWGDRCATWVAVTGERADCVARSVRLGPSRPPPALPAVNPHTWHLSPYEAGVTSEGTIDCRDDAAYAAISAGWNGQEGFDFLEMATWKNGFSSLAWQAALGLVAEPARDKSEAVLLANSVGHDDAFAMDPVCLWAFESAPRQPIAWKTPREHLAGEVLSGF